MMAYWLDIAASMLQIDLDAGFSIFSPSRILAAHVIRRKTREFPFSYAVEAPVAYF